MSTITFKEVVSQGDWETFQALRREIVSDRPMSVEDLQEIYNTHSPQKPRHRLVGYRGTEAVVCGGFNYNPWVGEPDVYSLQVLTRPDVSRQETAELLDHLLGLTKQAGAKVVTSWVRDSWTDNLAEHRERGFQLHQQNPESIIYLDEYDPGRFEPAVQRLAENGIRILSYGDFIQERPATFEDDLWVFESEIIADIPMPVPAPAVPREMFVEGLRQFEKHYQTSWLALKEEELLAVSQVEIYQSDRTMASNGLTGTRRTARRQGLALGLKAFALKSVKEMGVKTLSTDNEESNPMFDINVQLGFELIYQNLGMILRIQ